MTDNNNKNNNNQPTTDHPIDSSEKIKQVALELLPELRKQLNNEDGDGDYKNVSDDCLLRFLYWKQDVGRAKERIHKLNDYYKENTDMFGKINDENDPTLQRVLECEAVVAPPGMLSKHGYPVLIGRLRNNDMTDGRKPKDVVRMVVYTMDRVLEDPVAQTKGIIIFHDLRGLSRSNIDPGIPKILFNAIIGHFPLRIQGIYLLDAPIFFRAIFSVISLLLPKKLRDRTNFVNSISEIPIDTKDLLTEHGGERTHNQKEWVKLQIQREKDGTQSSILDSFKIVATEGG